MNGTHENSYIGKNQDPLNSQASLIINLHTYWYPKHQLKKWHVSFNSLVEYECASTVILILSNISPSLIAHWLVVSQVNRCRVRIQDINSCLNPYPENETLTFIHFHPMKS